MIYIFKQGCGGGGGRREAEAEAARFFGNLKEAEAVKGRLPPPKMFEKIGKKFLKNLRH